MSDARWQRLQELFESLLTLAPEARAAWLDGVDADADLKREALALAAASTDEDGTPGLTGHLSALAAQAVAPQPGPQRIGPYRLLEEIGSGGMGTVFLAERVDADFDQRVAIKLLRGIPTRESTERMRRERQILADLSHPHIARLLDGGSTADGQPYLVMEYVEGEPLNTFCRRHALVLDVRLHLLRKICGAMQYAHQRLIIHRDLKPANVLVRSDGEPVLLDFGIAKLLGDSADTVQTGLPWFTPAYASPEQRGGHAVSTATDVYGLGLLLYEAVADTAPQRDAAGRLPPLAAGKAQRGKLADLDRIIAKATQAEPERRYVSAAALADDLQHLLRGHPVQAAPDTLLYRLGKFAGRHRFAVAAGTATLVLAGVFTWRLASERDRALRAEALARQQSATAESVVDYLVSLFHSASPEETGTRPIAPRDLVDRGRREIDARLASAPHQRARLLGALGRIYMEIGLPDEAAESLGSAADLERSDGTPRGRAAWLMEQGYALNLAERPGAAEPVLREGVALLGEVAPADRKLAADLLTTLALAQARNGDPRAGLANVQRAIGYSAQASGEDSTEYAQCLYARAETELRLGQLEAAEVDAQRSVELMRRHLPEDAAEVLSAQGFLSSVYEQQGRYADGERLLRGMLKVRLRTLEPGSAWAVTARNNLAQAIQLQGRIVEATALMRENVDHMRAQHQEDTSSYFIGLNNLASLLEQAGDLATALPMFTEVLQNAERASAKTPDPRLSLYRQNLGRSLMLNGHLDAARPLLERPVEGDADSRDLAVERGRRLLHLAEWMRRSGKLDEALAYTDQAAETFAALLGDEHPRLGAVARTRGLILRDQHRLAEAEATTRRAAGILSAKAGRDANATIDTELQLAEILFALGRADEARTLQQRIEPLLAGRFVDNAEVRRRCVALGRQLGDVSRG
jgi:serine/threonine-protein kinase